MMTRQEYMAEVLEAMLKEGIGISLVALAGATPEEAEVHGPQRLNVTVEAMERQRDEVIPLPKGLEALREAARGAKKPTLELAQRVLEQLASLPQDASAFDWSGAGMDI